MLIDRYLQDVFNEDINLKKFGEVELIPLLIRNEYEFFEGNLHGYSCFFMRFQAKKIVAEKILKHFVILENSFNKKLVLVFDELRPYQRRNLVKNRIAFVVPETQIYLPFIFLDFSENFYLSKPKIERFTPSIQSVYLSIYYQENDVVNVNDLSEKLSLSKISVYRAIASLATRSLINVDGKSTRKQFQRISKDSYWMEGKDCLVSPVKKQIFLSRLPEDLDYFVSNESALSELSMMSYPRNTTYAISKETAKKIDKNIMYSERMHENNQDVNMKYTFEIWSYDPGLFSSNKVVDICSLYAQLRNLDDPRTDIELERLLGREL